MAWEYRVCHKFFSLISWPVLLRTCFGTFSMASVAAFVVTSLCVLVCLTAYADHWIFEWLCSNISSLDWNNSMKLLSPWALNTTFPPLWASTIISFINWGTLIKRPPYRPLLILYTFRFGCLYFLSPSPDFAFLKHLLKSCLYSFFFNSSSLFLDLISFWIDVFSKSDQKRIFLLLCHSL